MANKAIKVGDCVRYHTKEDEKRCPEHIGKVGRAMFVTSVYDDDDNRLGLERLKSKNCVLVLERTHEIYKDAQKEDDEEVQRKREECRKETEEMHKNGEVGVCVYICRQRPIFYTRVYVTDINKIDEEEVEYYENTKDIVEAIEKSRDSAIMKRVEVINEVRRVKDTIEDNIEFVDALFNWIEILLMIEREEGVLNG